MLVVKLWGGLGNQLFQYAFGLFMAKMRNESVFYCSLDKDVKKLEINCLDPSLLVVSENIVKKYFFIDSLLWYRAMRKMLQFLPGVHKKIVIEKGSHDLTLIGEEAEFFDGYWQSLKYIRSVEDELRDSLQLDISIGFTAELCNEIKNCNSISVHIRRGDYNIGRNKFIYENLGMDYYLDAMFFARSTINNPIFYIFSNDMDWVRRNLPSTLDLKYVFVQSGKLPSDTLADFYLMSNCKHNIISNSTFSWWGAFLNSTPQKIVIAPKKWYKSNLRNKKVDIFPDNWLRF